MCDCTYSQEVTLQVPKHFAPWRERRTACIDPCIVDQIKALWAADIETLGCCCGHDKEPPSVVIEKHYTKQDVERIAHILEDNDTRAWTILQWTPTKLEAVAVSQSKGRTP